MSAGSVFYRGFYLALAHSPMRGTARAKPFGRVEIVIYSAALPSGIFIFKKIKLLLIFVTKYNLNVTILVVVTKRFINLAYIHANLTLQKNLMSYRGSQDNAGL